ncbi:MAG TPA: hypothetical protein VLD65_01505 [Anaerolineales bacterium]|nr:hypothetical protein [Anaerolineales bacterium]
MIRQKTYLPLFICFLVLTACSTSASPPSPVQSTPPEMMPTYVLSTPYAQQPAAGICASSDGQIVEITINVDMPSPRCAKIRPEQTLVIVNATLSTIQVSIGNFSTSILPGAQYPIDVPFGDYLAPGVHLINATPYFGAELWLESSK